MKKIIIALLLITSIAYSQNKQDTSTYYLIGKYTDFQLLFLAIKSPQDITPRQDTALLHWIETIRKAEILKPKTDSSKAKK